MADGKGTTVCILNKYGKIAKNEWMRTSEIRINIHLLEFIIIPNHVHGIIEIDDCRGTMHRAPTMIHRIRTCEQFGQPTSNTIPTIIRGYKSSVTKQINILRDQPGKTVWQRNYYEHIIRDEDSYNTLSEYIKNNPKNWQDDDYYL